MRRSILGRASLVSAFLLSAIAFGQADTSLEEALKLFEQGNYEAATAAFERIFAEAPSDDAVMDLLTASDYERVIKLVSSDDPRLVGIGIRLMKLQRSMVEERMADQSAIQESVDSYLNASDAQERLRLRLEIARTAGRNAVPYLVSKLASPNVEVRTRAQLLIAMVGTSGVPVLVAASEHPSPQVRTAVAGLLANRNLRLPYNAAALARLAQNDADVTVKAAARQSLQVLLSEYGTGEREAKEYFYSNARQLYRFPHRNPFSSQFYAPTVFRLEGEEVVGEEVASFQLADRMAEQDLLSALRLDPESVDARAMLACTDALQLVEYERAVETAAETDPELGSLLAAQRLAMQFAREPRLLATSGAAFDEALALALDDGINVVSERLLRAFAQAGRGSATVPPAVERAIGASASRAVRVHGAIALSEWGGSLSGETAQAVVSVLAEAVVNSGIRTVHQIFGDPENVNRFGGHFQSLNLDAYANSPDVEAGIARAGQLPPDLLIIDDQAPATTGRAGITPINHFVRLVRDSYRTREVPIIVVVDPARMESVRGLYEGEGRNVTVIPANIERQTLKDTVIDPLFADADDAKAAATELSVRAADALEALSKQCSSMPLAGATESLTMVVQNRPDAVRIPCLRTLGNLREDARSATGVLASLFANDQNSVEVRESAMLAVARILGGDSASDSVLKIITDGMAESDLRLRRASYIAYGAANPPAGDAVERFIHPAVEVDASALETAGVTGGLGGF